MLCHSVLSCRLPSASVHISDVAIGKRATARPVEVKRTSGSFPKLPIRIALFTDIRASRLSQNRVSTETAKSPYLRYNFQSIMKFSQFRDSDSRIEAIDDIHLRAEKQTH